MYGNEADVGKAIKDSNVPRESVFVTSKIFDADWGYEAATDAIHNSLESLGMQYLDLMLMHHPGERWGRKETWQALEDAHKQVQSSCVCATHENMLQAWGMQSLFLLSTFSLEVCRASAKALA